MASMEMKKRIRDKGLIWFLERSRATSEGSWDYSVDQQVGPAYGSRGPCRSAWSARSFQTLLHRLCSSWMAKHGLVADQLQIP